LTDCLKIASSLGMVACFAVAFALSTARASLKSEVSEGLLSTLNVNDWPAVTAAAFTLALLGDWKARGVDIGLAVPGGLVRNVGGSRRVSVSAQGGFTRTFGPVSALGGVFTPRGNLVWAGTPSFCSRNDGKTSRAGLLRNDSCILSNSVLRKSTSWRMLGTCPPYPAG